MEGLVKEGKVRSIGLFNASTAEVQQVLDFCEIQPAVNSVEVHPHCRNTELVDFCKSKVSSRPASPCLHVFAKCTVLLSRRPGHLHLWPEAALHHMHALTCFLDCLNRF